MTPRMTKIRSIIAEAVGTALLLATVVGSGIMGDRLAGGNVAIALLANTLATARCQWRSFSPSAPFQERTSIPL